MSFAREPRSKEPEPSGAHHPKQQSISSPPVNISSQAYLDPACYVRGHNLLVVESSAIIHPRCRLYTDQGNVTIGTGAILLERCILGADKDFNPAPEGSVNHSGAIQGDDRSMGMVIGPRAYLHSAVKLLPPCTIGEEATLEAGVKLSPGCTIGAHSKICAGIMLPANTVIPEWTVVYGLNGQMRRKRQPNLADDTRLEGVARERQGMEILLKMNASKNLSAAGGGSRSKRESVIRTDSQRG